MKIGTMVKVIASTPQDVQESVEQLVGETYEVKEHWKQTNSTLKEGEIIVRCEKWFGGDVILNSNEYAVVEQNEEKEIEINKQQVIDYVIEAKDCFQNGGYHKWFEEVDFATIGGHITITIRIKKNGVEINIPYKIFINMEHGILADMIILSMSEVDNDYYDEDLYKRETL